MVTEWFSDVALGLGAGGRQTNEGFVDGHDPVSTHGYRCQGAQEYRERQHGPAGV